MYSKGPNIVGLILVMLVIVAVFAISHANHSYYGVVFGLGMLFSAFNRGVMRN